MDDVKIVIDRMKVQTGSRTYQELADKLGIKLSAINSWKRRGFVPEKNLLKCVQMTNTPLKFFEEGTPSLPLGKNGEYAEYQLVSDGRKRRIQYEYKPTGVSEPKQYYGAETPQIQTIIDILSEMDTDKIKDILRYVLEVDSRS